MSPRRTPSRSRLVKTMTEDYRERGNEGTGNREGGCEGTGNEEETTEIRDCGDFESPTLSAVKLRKGWGNHDALLDQHDIDAPRSKRDRQRDRLRAHIRRHWRSPHRG